MNLDFSALSDDQLVGLIRAACAEAVARGTVVASAARAAYLSEAERAEIARAAADQEAEKIRREEAARLARETAERVRREEAQKAANDAAAKERTAWARKKGIALEVERIFGATDEMGTFVVNVWRDSRTQEQRVYLGHGYNSNRATYFVTGNRKNPPGTLEVNTDLKDKKAEIERLCKAIVSVWSVLKFEVRAALKWDGEAIPCVTLEGAA